MNLTTLKFALLIVLVVGAVFVTPPPEFEHVEATESVKGISTEIKESETTNTPTEVEEPIKEIEPKQEKPAEPKPTEAELRAQLVKDNPKNCDRDTQEIWWPDGKCHTVISKAKVTSPPQVASKTNVTSAGSNYNCANPGSAKAFIYCKESTNNPAAVNAGGCRGLGQACPGSKLPCGSHDYACQDNWFTNYMLERYGSWEAAKAHWLARVPINGKDVGHWW